MKIFRIIFYIFPLFLWSGSLYAQWLQQTSGTEANLRDIEFLNVNTGWIVGDGTILKTTNGGLNWVNQQSPLTDRPFFNIHIVDSNVAYIAGWFETVLKTTNGGLNWIIMRTAPLGQGNSYQALYFINENTGWFAGDGDLYLKTTNGGQNFIEHFISNSPDIQDMYFKDANTGLMTGGGLDNYKTTDAGETWKEISMPIGSGGPEFSKLSIVNNQYGWVISYAKAIVFKTSDFGDTWECIDTISTGSLQTRMLSICFVNEETGFAGGSMGKLYKSTDGGSNWVRENSGYFPPNDLMSIHLVNIPANFQNPTGWICGGAGKIIKTTTGGETYVGIGNDNTDVLNQYRLLQNYPNPFNPTTKIVYDLPMEGIVTIKVYDIMGREIKTLLNEFKRAGNYSVQFDAGMLSSGIYFYRLKVNNFIETKKMMVLK